MNTREIHVNTITKESLYFVCVIRSINVCLGDKSSWLCIQLPLVVGGNVMAEVGYRT